MCGYQLYLRIVANGFIFFCTRAMPVFLHALDSNILIDQYFISSLLVHLIIFIFRDDQDLEILGFSSFFCKKFWRAQIGLLLNQN